MSVEENKAILRRAVERFGDKENREEYFELYAPDAMLRGYQEVEPGLEGIRRYYEARWAAFPDAHLTAGDMIAKGDKVGCRFTLRATHEGEFNGMPPTGKRVTMTGITILRFEDGRCVERWSQADLLGLMQQLGAVPEHAA